MTSYLYPSGIILDERQFMIELLTKAHARAVRAVAEDTTHFWEVRSESAQLRAHAKMVEGLLYRLGGTNAVSLGAKIRGAMIEPELSRLRSKRFAKERPEAARAATFLRIWSWPSDTYTLDRLAVFFEQQPGANVRIRIAGPYESEIELHLDLAMIELPDMLKRFPDPLGGKDLMKLGFKSVMPETGGDAP